MLEGMDEDLGFSLPPVLTEEKEEQDESTPRPQPRRLVCTLRHINKGNVLPISST